MVTLLKEELPHIKTFSTLSPVPGLRKWLESAAEDHEHGTVQEQALLAKDALANDDWQEDGDTRRRLLELCAQYLVREKRGRVPLNAVARFHLGNGARLERINWQGDMSANGIAQSAGILVNYLYDEGSIERNHEVLVNAGEVVHSTPVKRLLPTLPKPQEKTSEEPKQLTEA